jgi:hypothetical protein
MKNFHLVLILVSGLLSVGLLGCAEGRVQRQLDAKLLKENSVRSRSDLAAEFDQLVKVSSALTEEQRERLIHLKSNVVVESNQLSERSTRLKSLMVKKLLVADSSPDELALIKSKIIEVESERLSLVFNALGRANTILGHWQPQQDKEGEILYEQMMLEMMDSYH